MFMLRLVALGSGFGPAHNMHKVGWSRIHRHLPSKCSFGRRDSLVLLTRADAREVVGPDGRRSPTEVRKINGWTTDMQRIARLTTLEVLRRYSRERWKEVQWRRAHPEVANDEELKTCRVCDLRISGDIDFFVLQRFHCRQCRHRTHLGCAENRKAPKICRACSDPLFRHRPDLAVTEEVWPLLTAAETDARREVAAHLDRAFGPNWRHDPGVLGALEPRLKGMRALREQKKDTDGDLLSYAYLMELHTLMAGAWEVLGAPWLGETADAWQSRFQVLTTARNHLAHHRFGQLQHEVVAEAKDAAFAIVRCADSI